MRKFTAIVLSILLIITLVGCSNNEETKTDTTTKTEDTASTTDTTKSNSYSSSSKSSSTSTITHYCDAPDCTREGTKSYSGIGGQTEYYCLTHYNEIIDIMSDMEEDVGKSSYSKHTCEECSREGTYSIVGISGSTEYYCSTHYRELKELLEMFE